MKILMLEDEIEIAEPIAERLSSLGYVVEHVESGDDAVAFLQALDYDLIILDINVPGMSGIEVLKFEKTRRPESKVLMLTSQSAIDEKLKGFALGADDYLPKPFDMRELVARVEALVRRPAAVATQTIRSGAVELDTRAKDLKINGRAVKLQKQDFVLLEFFLQNPNQVFSAESLIERVWRYDSNASIAGLRMAISRIRKAASDAGIDSEQIIETVARQGYRLKK